MTKFGCPAKYIAMVRHIHDGVTHDCVLASALFSMMFSAMRNGAFQDGDNGITIKYRFDQNLFNLRKVQAKFRVQTEVLDEFLFADDMATGAPTESNIQKGLDQVSVSCDSKISHPASERLRWYIS